MSLVSLVRTELVARKGSWPDISRQTNLSYWWVTKFAQGRIENPGVLKLERLQAHFGAHPRDVGAEAPGASGEFLISAPNSLLKNASNCT